MPALEPARIVVDQGILNIDADQQSSPPFNRTRISALDGNLRYPRIGYLGQSTGFFFSFPPFPVYGLSRRVFGDPGQR
jgi:hypothetical protein